MKTVHWPSVIRGQKIKIRHVLKLIPASLSNISDENAMMVSCTKRKSNGRVFPPYNTKKTSSKDFRCVPLFNLNLKIVLMLAKC